MRSKLCEYTGVDVTGSLDVVVVAVDVDLSVVVVEGNKVVTFSSVKEVVVL